MCVMSEIQELLQRYQDFIYGREHKKLDASEQCDRGELTQFQLNKIVKECDREINHATKKIQELRQQSQDIHSAHSGQTPAQNVSSQLNEKKEKDDLKKPSTHSVDGKYKEFSNYLLKLKANQLYVIFKAITIDQKQSSSMNRKILTEKIIDVIKEDSSALEKIKILAREFDMADLLVHVPDN